MLKEKNLYYSNGELGAISVSLSDTAEFIKTHYPNLAVSVHEDNYDDYGCDHFIKISGKCADLILKKDYGGMHCPADYFNCNVELHRVRDNSSSITHEYKFKDQAPADVSIGDNYADNIKKYIDTHEKYLASDASLFSRIDYRRYKDGRGVHKYHHCATPYSWDVVHVSDDDFYTDVELNTSITSRIKDVDELFEKIRLQYRRVIKTSYGYILVESPLGAENNPEDDFFSENRWAATLVIDSCYPPSMSGDSEKEAIDRLLDLLSELD